MEGPAAEAGGVNAPGRTRLGRVRPRKTKHQPMKTTRRQNLSATALAGALALNVSALSGANGPIAWLTLD